MNHRVSPWEEVALPEFEAESPKKKEVDLEALSKLADSMGFPSRQARKSDTVKSIKDKVKRGRRKTSNQDEIFTVRSSSATKERFYAHADKHRVSLGKMIELMLDAYDTLETKLPE